MEKDSTQYSTVQIGPGSRKRTLNEEELGKVNGGNYVPGIFTAEAMFFMQTCLGDEKYKRIMGTEKARQHPYVAAKLFLTPSEWEKYVWIEQNGSLEGFG